MTLSTLSPRARDLITELQSRGLRLADPGAGARAAAAGQARPITRP